MKYIISQLPCSKPSVTVFSERMQHIDMAMALYDYDYTPAKILGAGFCELSPAVIAYGKSDTLRIKSRGSIDAALIASHCGLKVYDDLAHIR